LEASTKAKLHITFPQPCVIYLNSTKKTPKQLTWGIDFFDGQKVALKVPTIRLAELSVEEIAQRDLLPIGQFYMRTFGTLNKKNIERFLKTANFLLAALKDAVENEVIKYDTGLQMQETIRKTMENIIAKSEQEVDFVMETNIIETLPWIDYSEVFRKLEERGKAKGIAEGIAEGIVKRDMEIAQRAFMRLDHGGNVSEVTNMLKDLGVADTVIKAAQKAVMGSI
jgi:hypothetical protein